ncbi:MAG: GrpB family protein, partial [Saprospiraceae bacterium]|nr:GrpB family protein [Saprospiraceae bacterium]
MLFEALRGMHIRIEHVGSTAVRQLAAKPVIDIDSAFGTEVSFALLKSRLENIGYSHHGDQGITGREVFKRKDSGGKHKVLDSIQHHLYVCSLKNEEYQRHLVFRNYLIGNQPAREAYESLKYKIADAANQDKKT